MREIITLQVGQCGNQIGKGFWDKISSEHNIALSGEHTPLHNDRKDIFFYEADDGKYVPRGIAIDLEPRVINTLISSTPFFNQENIFVSEDGCGAGNNWADGYFTAKKNYNEIHEIIQREAENTEFLEGFFLMHSIAGGTGSGSGSLILEKLRDEFPKKIIQTYSILPNNNEVSDVVVQPYNSILTLHRLATCSDLVLIMDNNALGKIALDSLRIKTPTFNHMNNLISTAIAASTSTLRFPTYQFADLPSIVNTLTPTNHKFIIPSYTPFISPENRILRKSNCSDIMQRLLLQKTKMATSENKQYSILSTLNIFSGVESPQDLQRTLLRTLDKNTLQFVPWMPPSFHTVIANNPYLTTNRVSALSLTNTTAAANLLKKIAEQYDMLKKRNAFIDIYKRFNEDLSMFDESREVVKNVINEYENAELKSYI